MEKEEHSFIIENSNAYRIRLLLFSLLGILVLLAGIIAFRDVLWEATKQNNLIQSVVNLAKGEFTQLSPSELFFAGLLGGLFFILMPLELIFSSSLVKGSDPLLSLLMIIIGFTLSQIINYFLGSKFSPLIMNFISKKKVYSVRRFINKYGGYGVFLLNLSPLPAEILTFALGITKYNVYRLFLLQIIGCTIKYSVIVAITLLF